MLKDNEGYWKGGAILNQCRAEDKRKDPDYDISVVLAAYHYFFVNKIFF